MPSPRSWVISAAVLAGLLFAWGLLTDSGDIDAWLRMAWDYGKLGDMPVRSPVPSPWQVRSVLFVFEALALFTVLWPRPAMALSTKLIESWRYGIGSVRQCLADMTGWELAFFYGALAVCTALRIYHALTYPVMADEALTWLLFTTKGPLACAAFYPAPNNHILHSLLTTASAWHPIDPLFALRLPVIVAALLTQAMLHLMLRRLFGPAAAVILVACAISSPPFLYYGVFSRGYMLVLLAFIVAFAATLLALRTGDRRALGLLSISCVLGLFTMPSFLYPAVLLFGFLFCFAPSSVLSRASVLRAGMATIGATIILYLPALILNGVDAFTSSIWVRPTGVHAVTQGWWKHFQSTFSWLLGLPFAFQIMMVLIATVLLIARGRDRRLSAFASFIILASLVIPFVHRVIPFERTWIYLLVPIAILLGFLVRATTAWIHRPAHVIPVAAAVFGLSEYRYVQALPLQEYTAYHARDLFDTIRDEEPKDILCEMPTVGVHLVFEMEKLDIPFTYAVLRRDEDRNARLDAGHRLVLVDRSRPLVHSGYEEIYADGIQRLYRRRE